MNRVFLYGIAGLEDQYRIVRYIYIDGDKECITIRSIINNAAWLKFKNQTVEYVYAIDESAQLAYDYKTTKRNNSFADNIQFKCMLEKCGLRII